MIVFSCRTTYYTICHALRDKHRNIFKQQLQKVYAEGHGILLKFISNQRNYLRRCQRHSEDVSEQEDKKFIWETKESNTWAMILILVTFLGVRHQIWKPLNYIQTLLDHSLSLKNWPCPLFVTLKMTRVECRLGYPEACCSGAVYRHSGKESQRRNCEAVEKKRDYAVGKRGNEKEKMAESKKAKSWKIIASERQ